ncbi:hypothetical protein ACFFRR_003419 [Megaselia abdita]
MLKLLVLTTAFALCLSHPLDEISKTNGTAQDVIDLSQYSSEIYGKPDEKETGKVVEEYTEDSGVNPEELGSYVEGDILFTEQRTGRNGLAKQTARWPNGIVPFVIEGNFNNRDMGIIEEAVMEYHRKTCIRFVPRSSETDYISLVSGRSGCWSAVGRTGGRQEVNLQSPGCLTKVGTAIHELMHALGFLHEQNRHERDDYVTVQFQNIQPSAVGNFDKASAASTIDFGVPYDYGSVMHYSGSAFSTNGRPTIIARQGNANMGQRDGFSPRDLQKVNSMYNCNRNSAGIEGNGVVPQQPHGQAGGRPNLFLSFLGGLANGLGIKDEESVDNNKV